MDEHFDTVVVGSGFGGSVMAYRLAKARKKVCVLERGKAYRPGDFARSPYTMKTNFWDPSEGLQGLFNVWTFRGLGAIVSSGLGGGSLIYANVLLRKDEKTFVKEDIHNGGWEYWPVNRRDLDPHYSEVERMMNAQKYPLDDEDERFSRAPKTRALQDAATRLGLEWKLAPLAVTFRTADGKAAFGEPIHEEHRNLYGVTRYTCRLCGECDVGCNYGSKNTLDLNYLSEAKRHGAEIRTLCEVRSFAPRSSGGYTVRYVKHLPANEGRKTDTKKLPIQTLTCDRLVLSAGTLGSPYLLLRNRDAFPAISERLGTRFSGNGDLLTFAVKSMNGSKPPTARLLDPSYGPVITSYVRVPDALDGGEGREFYVEDAGYPDFVNWMVQLADVPAGFQRVVDFAARWIKGWLRIVVDTDLGSEIAQLFGDCALSKGSLPLLGMGRDIPNGRMDLIHDGRLDVDWRIDASRAYFERVRRTMKDLSTQLDARFADDPIWYLSRVITVHPLGGCPMGRHPQEGVVDSHGQVFHYPGLYVADGSVMPGPVGANPSLTIAALANRFADGITGEQTAAP